MADSKPSFDIVSKVADLILGAALGKITDKAKRSEKVIQILKQVGLSPDSPPADDFDGVFAYTLVFYGVDKPKAILEFFRHPFIRSAFRKSFETRDPSYLEEECENFLDWSPIAKELLSTMDYDPRQEFAAFREQFITSAKLSRNVQDILVDQALEDISKDIQELPTKEDLTSQLSSLQDNITEAIAGTKRQDREPPFRLPPIDLSKFTGREKEIQDLENLIFNQDGSRVVGIVGLTGTGGMGKTALAVHFAHLYREHFPDGVIGMRVDGETVDEIARRFALHVVDKVGPSLKASDIMPMVFQNRRMLLILDNVEDATARELEPGGDKCAVIITTRNRGLNLGTTGQINLNRFSLKETHDLLISFLKERVDAEVDDVERIHELIGGLPLAVRIVGGALADERETTLNEFADRLKEARNRLSLHDQDDDSLNLHASINVSLNKLSKPQVYLFSCLGLCAPEGFSSETIVAISQHNIDDVKINLARLVKLSLVDFSEENRRYLLHPLLFDASRELARGENLEVESSNTFEDIRERHIAYFRNFSHAHKGFRLGNLNALEREIDELLLTAKRLIGQGIADYGFYLSLEPFFQNRGYWAQAIEIINAYLDIARNHADWESVIQLHIQNAQFLVIAGQFLQAELALKNAQRDIKNVKSEQQAIHLESMVLNSLGGVLQRQGRFDEAVDTFQRSVNIAEKLGDHRHLAVVLNSLGGLMHREGKFNEAIYAFQRSYELLIRLGDDHGQAMVLNSLGGVLQRLGKFDEAVDTIERSYEISERLGEDRGQAMVLNSLGGVLQRQGKFDDAMDAFQRSYELVLKLGDDRGQAMVLNSLGGVLQRLGKFYDAVDAFQRSYELVLKLGDDRGQAMVLNSLGGALQRQGKFDDAVDAFQRSAEIGETIEDYRHLAMVLNSLGGVLQRQGKFDDAVDAFQRSAEIEERLGNDHGQAMVLNSLGGVLQRLGKFYDAVDAFQQSYELVLKLGDDRGQAMVLNSLGGALQRQGKFDDAVDAFQRSAEIGETIEDYRHLAMVLNSLGGVFSKQKKYDDANNKYKESIAIGKQLCDKSHLAKVYTSFGKSLLDQDKFNDAALMLTLGFEFDEKLHNKFGLRIVTPALVDALKADNRIDEALEICNRALAIAPKDNLLQRTKHRVLQTNERVQKTGHIKKVFHHEKGYLYGFITTDDGSPDVYFNEREIDSSLLSKLVEGLIVVAEIELRELGPRAIKVWLKE